MGTMVLGMMVLVILVIGCSLAIGMVILPAHPQTASAYNCFVTTHECLETRDPVDLMTKLFPGMMPSNYG